MGIFKRLFGGSESGSGSPDSVPECASRFVHSLEAIDDTSDEAVRAELERSLASSGDALGSIKGAEFVIAVLKEVYRQSNRHGLALARIWDISSGYLK